MNPKLNPTLKPNHFITAYGPKNRTHLVIPTHELSRTKQAHLDECDINKIMSRYNKTGILDFVTKHAPCYGDATAGDYQSSMQIVATAQSMFHELPSAIRDRFQNSPAQFLDFLDDPANLSEMHSLGLLRPDYQPPPTDAPAPNLAAPQPNPSPDPKPKA